ncbi:aminoglycoside phosphotransferase [Streptomyces sp. NRRL F-4489]|uniref:phosphotransferase family protein n=1 Tax=Streptomyces sp. NRRL F-4489 TaxID=1609095 RepID=UPI000748291E|nr:phosphotransferase [Streptomyces sp. NRRL F-4489]KUL38882.1 aminoglycoside phosphotransferase [Streptomyces sp. NRRL F-4489]
MLSRPSSVSDDDVAGAVAAHWLPGVAQVSEITYLPVGFGAHHWRAVAGGMALFVTLDQLAPRHTEASLEAAYAGAAALAAAGLEAVCPPLPTPSGRFTVPFQGGALSATPWVVGRTPTEEEAAEPGHVRQVATALAALHAAAPPDGLRQWSPRVGPAFAQELDRRTAQPWTSGPLAEEARTAMAARSGAVHRWTARYHQLAQLAARHRDRWVVTHGEPHHANQIITPGGLRLVDWESLALAPRERDYADLLEAGAADPVRPDPVRSGPVQHVLVRPDPAMVELFALDWRLSELDEFARWFSSPHTGAEDDHTALAGLYEELAEADA